MIDKAYTDMYGDEYFIRLLGRGAYPSTKEVRGSNFCDIGWHIDLRTGRIIVLSAIDNLVKGAAGQLFKTLILLAVLMKKQDWISLQFIHDISITRRYIL